MTTNILDLAEDLELPDGTSHLREVVDHPGVDQILDRCHPILVDVDDADERAKWLQLRPLGLGGSDTGAIFGLSPYKSPYTVWAEKTGRLPPIDLSTKEAIYWGVTLEPIVRAEFARRTGYRVFHPKVMLVERDHPNLFINLDGLYVDEYDRLLPFEAKTGGAHTARHWNPERDWRTGDLVDEDWENGAVPPWYEAQTVRYAAGIGAPMATIAVLLGGQRFEMRPIHVDDDLAATVTAGAEAWWNRHIANDTPDNPTPPPVDTSTDCTDTLAKLWSSRDDLILADHDLLATCVEYLDAHDQLEDAKSRKTLAGNRIRAALGPAWTASALGRPVATWKPARAFDEAKFRKDHADLWHQYAVPTLDYDRLKTEHPAVVDQYRTTSDEHRRLTVKPVARQLLDRA